MPLRLQSIQRNQYDTGILSFIAQQDMEKWDAKVQSKSADGNTYFHYTHFMRDVYSGEIIGKFVVTLREVTKRSGLFKKETHKEILDMDLTLEGEAEVEMRFLNMLPGSSGANEYYDVELEGHQRFQIETVNRHAITGKIEGTKQKVKASAFPFRLSVYDSMAAMNEALHTKEIFGGRQLSDEFAAPGSAAIEILRMQGNKDEISAFLIGTVKSVKDVEVKLGEMKLSFALVRMETALGILPVAMGRSVFNIDEIAPGKVVSMFADIKADFAVDHNPVGHNVPQDYEEAREWIENKADEVFNMLTKGPDSAATFDFEKTDIGNIIEFGTYPQDAQGRIAPIEWQVLAKESGRILVVSKFGLDRQAYNTSDTSVTWETCSLRKWLNGAFLNTAFSAKERDRIPVVTVNADENPDYGTSPGNSTTDRVFLLSITEANKYFSSNSTRGCQGTEYSNAQDASETGNGNCWWWLRSPGVSGNVTAIVSFAGSVFTHGFNVDAPFDVRPALWINPES